MTPMCPLRALSPLPVSPPPLPSSPAQEELVSNTELVQSYRQQISNVVNQANLQLFWNMYNRCVCVGSPSPQGGQHHPQLVEGLLLKSGRGQLLAQGAASSELRGSRAMDSGPWVLALLRCRVERMSAAPLVPTSGLGAQPCFCKLLVRKLRLEKTSVRKRVRCRYLVRVVRVVLEQRYARQEHHRHRSTFLAQLGASGKES